MKFIKRVERLSDEKLPKALRAYISRGYEHDVLQVVPVLLAARPGLERQLGEIVEEARQALTAAQEGNGFEAVRMVQCENCGFSMRQFNPSSEVMCCESCGTMTGDPSAGNMVRGLPHHPLLKMHAVMERDGKKWQVIGYQHYKGTVEEWDSEDDCWETSKWRYQNWWMLSDKREIAWLIHDAEGFYWSEKTTVVGEIPKKRPGMELGKWELTDAIGEFTYRPRIGEKVRSYEKDGYSVEVMYDESGKKKEIEAFESTSLRPLDLLAAFGGGRKLVHAGRLKILVWSFALAILFLIAGRLIMGSLERDLVTLPVFAISTAAQGLEQPVSRFDLAEDSVLRFQAYGEIPRSLDGGFEAEIIVRDELQNTVAEMLISLWRESGVDSDGRWVESKTTEDMLIKLPAGTGYVISIKPDSFNVWEQVRLHTRVYHGSVSTVPVVIAAITALLLLVYFYFSRRTGLRRAAGLGRL